MIVNFDESCLMKVRNVEKEKKWKKAIIQVELWPQCCPAPIPIEICYKI